MILLKIFLGPRLQAEKEKVQQDEVVISVPPVSTNTNDEAEIKNNEVEIDTSLKNEEK